MEDIKDGKEEVLDEVVMKHIKYPHNGKPPRLDRIVFWSSTTTDPYILEFTNVAVSVTYFAGNANSLLPTWKLCAGA